MTHLSLEQLSGYALAAIDESEAHTIESHLEACVNCSEDYAELAETTALLALAVSGPEPSPLLRQRILAAARAESAGVERREEVPGWWARLSLGFRDWRLVATGLAAVTAALALVFLMPMSGNGLEALLGEKGGSSHALVGSTVAGELLLGQSGKAVMSLKASPAPQGRVYQVWVIRAGLPQPDRAFNGDGRGRLIHSLSRGDVVAITLERPGAKAPSSAILAKSSI